MLRVVVGRGAPAARAASSNSSRTLVLRPPPASRWVLQRPAPSLTQAPTHLGKRLASSSSSPASTTSAGLGLLTPTERELLAVAVRLLAADAHCLATRVYTGYQTDWRIPAAARILGLSAATAETAETDRCGRPLAGRREGLLGRARRFLRAVLRACQVSLLLSPLAVSFPVMYLTRDWLPGLRRRWWAYALWSIEALGPCMVKFMQWASTRRDILAAEVCDMLEPIQGQTRPHAWAATVAALRTLREDWERVLRIDADSAMVGSGSVAQVYRGTALVPGAGGDPTAPPLPREVAVKVIHPDVKRQIELDLELMRLGAWLVELSGHLQWWSVREFVEEFACIMNMQLDLRTEARSLDRFRANFAEQRDIHFPAPLWPLVNEFVMVEEYVGGTPISQILKDPDYPAAEKHRIARSGLAAFLKMVFLDNFVHGDLHPGNIFVRENPRDKKHPHLTFIDAGIVTELTPRDRRNFIDLFYAIATGRGEEAGKLMIERARDHACSDPQGFSTGIATIVNEAVGNHLQLGKIRVGFLIQKVLGLCLQYQVKLESNFAAILLAIGVLEGVGRSLDPELDILTASTPFIVKSQLLNSKRWKEEERLEREAEAAKAAAAAAVAAGTGAGGQK